MGRRVTDEEMRGWEWMTREGPHEAREAIGRLIAEVRKLDPVLRELSEALDDADMEVAAGGRRIDKAQARVKEVLDG